MPLNNVKISKCLNDLNSPEYMGYWVHLLCIKGKCKVRYMGNSINLKVRDLFIIGNLDQMEVLEKSDDLEVLIVCVTGSFLARSSPSSNYGMKGQLTLFSNPVMHLNKEHFELCKQDFDLLKSRMENKSFRFYEEMILTTIQLLILDFFEIHSTIHNENDITLQESSIMTRFFELLSKEEFKNSRSVTYFAEKLFITPKHLSAVCKEVSGRSAHYWINRYCALELSRLLRDKNLTLANIAEIFGFENMSSFSRYVKNQLGKSPSFYRNS